MVSHEFVGKLFAPVLQWGSLVKFSHTVFAMPFALGMAVLSAQRVSVSGGQLFWILIALVSARTAAMSYNRLHDRHIDAQNPRTDTRELPAGTMSAQSVVVLLVLSSVVFFLSAAFLGIHCLVLAPVVLAVLLLYSHSKKFTQYSHLLLGLALALAPGGVWYALTAELSWMPVPMMAAVMFWVAGFDLLYACQDIDFDRGVGLFSIPAVIGADAAFRLAAGFHAVAVLLLLLTGVIFDSGFYYFGTVVIFGLLLLSQHRLVTPSDLSKIDAAFFTRNGLASILFLVGICVDVFAG